MSCGSFRLMFALPAEANDQVAEGLEQRSIVQDLCCMALTYKLVPELKVLGLQGFAPLGMEVIIMPLLQGQLQVRICCMPCVHVNAYC